MAVTKFSSKKAQELALEIGFNAAGKIGTGKDGAFTIADVRASVKPKEVVQKEAAKATENTAQSPSRYQVEKNPSGHIDKYNVVDCSKKEATRFVRDFGSESQAQDEAARLNELEA